MLPEHEHLRDDVAHHRLHLLDGDGAERGHEDAVRELPVVLAGERREEAVAGEGADLPEGLRNEFVELGLVRDKVHELLRRQEDDDGLQVELVDRAVQRRETDQRANLVVQVEVEQVADEERLGRLGDRHAALVLLVVGLPGRVCVPVRLIGHGVWCAIMENKDHVGGSVERGYIVSQPRSLALAARHGKPLTTPAPTIIAAACGCTSFVIHGILATAMAPGQSLSRNHVGPAWFRLRLPVFFSRPPRPKATVQHRPTARPTRHDRLRCSGNDRDATATLSRPDSQPGPPRLRVRTRWWSMADACDAGACPRPAAGALRGALCFGGAPIGSCSECRIAPGRFPFPCCSSSDCLCAGPPVHSTSVPASAEQRP